MDINAERAVIHFQSGNHTSHGIHTPSVFDVGVKRNKAQKRFFSQTHTWHKEKESKKANLSMSMFRVEKSKANVFFSFEIEKKSQLVLISHIGVLYM